jgi:hypothetical protein
MEPSQNERAASWKKRDYTWGLFTGLTSAR